MVALVASITLFLEVSIQLQLVIDIRGIDIHGFEYSRHPFHYLDAAHEPYFINKIIFADSIFAGLSSNTLTAKFDDQL